MPGLGWTIERAPRIRTVTIASGGVNSTSFEPGRFAKGVFQLPSAITGTEFTVEYSIDGTTFTQVPVNAVESNPITSAAASRTYRLPKATFAARYARIVATTAQGAARTITVIMST